MSQAEKLADAIVSTGMTPYRKDLTAKNGACFQRVLERCEDVRRFGSGALELAYVAAGKLEAFYEFILQPWDFAAGMLLVREAGGSITDYEGNLPHPAKPGSIVATNGKIHGELLALL